MDTSIVAEQKEHGDGGPAFPNRATGHVEPSEGSGHENLRLKSIGGMSLRDYFAAKAIPSVLSASADGYSGGYDYVAASVGAYLFADAMLAERAKAEGRA